MDPTQWDAEIWNYWNDLSGINSTSSMANKKRTRDGAPKTTRCYASDVERIQGKVNMLNSGVMQDVATMRPLAVRDLLTKLNIDVRGLLEASELRERLKELLSPPCTVCMEVPKVDDQLIFLKCNHVFHGECIHTWAQDDYEMNKGGDSEYRPRCPNCRKNCI